MAKKTIDVSEEVAEEAVAEETVATTERLEMDFGRTDLNELRDAVNELFRR